MRITVALSVLTVVASQSIDYSQGGANWQSGQCQTVMESILNSKGIKLEPNKHHRQAGKLFCP